MTDQQAAREIYRMATALRQYLKENARTEDPIILDAVQTIQANAIQLGAFPYGWLDKQPAPDAGEEEERCR